MLFLLPLERILHNPHTPTMVRTDKDITFFNEKKNLDIEFGLIKIKLKFTWEKNLIPIFKVLRN